MTARRALASGLAAAMAGAPVVVHAKPPKPVHARAADARKACAPYAEHIAKAEKTKGLPRHTLTSLGFTESGCDPKAENKKSKARGWGQFLPSGSAAVRRIQKARGDKAPWFKHADAWDAVKAIEAAAELVAWGLETCGSLSEAIGMYNTGKLRSNAFSRAVLRLAAAIRFVAGEEPRT